jgi:hypothetical protein
MSIRVGTLVTQYSDRTKEFPCIEYNEEHPDIPHFLRACVGMVQNIEDDPNYQGSDEWDHVALTVQWLSMCPYHHNHGQAVNVRVTIGEVYEIGQLDVVR